MMARGTNYLRTGVEEHTMPAKGLTHRFIFDDPKYAALATEGAVKYKQGSPFPHIAFDNFLPEDVADAVLKEFPQPGDIDWHNYNRQTEIKLVCADEAKFGPVTRNLFYQLHSLPFLRFLEKVTGIPNLIPDPALRGGGLHQIRRGGLLKLHADFNHHDATFLDRRVNILLYLNKDWKEEYGGYLELWNKDTSFCGDKILPVFNRLAIFSTTSESFHGHPDPLNCPEDMTRKSLALYFYTNGRPKGEADGIHTTIFKARPTEEFKGVFWRMGQDFAPPILWRTARRMRERFFSGTIQKRG
ncbi:MAG: 2OG-Fe(II) oxygenase [Hydrogenophaga sp.]|nr:2OG-Fe(II) oxygenase [Hydrogenophaga sp.]